MCSFWSKHAPALNVDTNLVHEPGFKVQEVFEDTTASCLQGTHLLSRN
jgi:hypothetical protein